MKKSAKATLIVLSVIVGVIAFAIGFFFLLIEPNINILNAQDLDLSRLTSYSRTVVLLDNNGEPIDDALYDNNKFYVRVNDLQQHTIDAFIAIEDKRFYKHSGVDYKRMASALMSNIRSRSFREGASTITQQLIKNTHLSNEKTLKRKITEMRMARKLERIYDKNQILESYFNILYFGSGIRGLGTASRVMFDKSASELTIAQSAALASVINNPSKYSPYNNFDNLTKRKELVLKQMLAQNYISQDEYDSAISEEIAFGKYKQNQYVTAALKQACSVLNCSEKELFINNYTIKTSYVPEIASKARSLVNEIDTKYVARVMILDNKTGGIVCDETNRMNYINPKRSPASAIKPFLSYAPALENGMNPLSQIVDEPTSFGNYTPSNYRNIYRGYQSLTDCLVYSSNIAAVKLLQQNGIENAKQVARSFGLEFDDEDNSLPIALGGMQHGVTLQALANAYRTLANNGLYSDIQYIGSIHDTSSLKYKTKSYYTRAVNDDTAYLLTNMLTECAQRGTAKKLKYSGIIAAKTGTNGDANGNYDCYCIAYTPQYTIAVWIGADETPIDNDITGAWCGNIVKALCDGETIKTNEPFEMPDSVAYFDIDTKELSETHNVYLADPLLPKRYRYRALLSKRHLPIRKSIEIFDFYDRYLWDDAL